MKQKCDIYLFAESVIAAGVQEDVDFIGSSFLVVTTWNTV
jgi:hypothetical protein